LILEDPENREALLMDIKVNKNQIMVCAYGAQWLELQEFYQLSQGKDDGNMFNYFCTMILLLSDLCLDRNFVAIHPLSKLYPYQLCYQIASQDYELSVRNAFTTLLTNL